LFLKTKYNKSSYNQPNHRRGLEIAELKEEDMPMV